jgi:hypothetical protein
MPTSDNQGAVFDESVLLGFDVDFEPITQQALNHAVANVLARRHPLRLRGALNDRRQTFGAAGLQKIWEAARVPIENSNSAILMMQSAKYRVGGNAAVELNCTREWSILVQR